MEMTAQCSDDLYPCTPPARLFSSQAEVGELKCMPLRLLSLLASALNLALNVKHLRVKVARQSVVQAACLLHALFLLTNTLGSH